MNPEVNYDPIVPRSFAEEQLFRMERMTAILRKFSFQENGVLSRRESEIMQQLSEGKNRRSIANELFIDIETVKSHLKSAYKKLNVHYKDDAIRVAKSSGCIL